MVNSSYRKGIIVVVVSACIVCFCHLGCKRRSVQPPAETAAPAAQSKITVDVTNQVPEVQEVQLVEEFNDQATTTAAPTEPTVTAQETISVEAESGPFTQPTAKQIQAALKNAGYYEGSVDGKIGPKSQEAILGFQRDNNLTTDGKVGQKTWSKLKKYAEQASQ